VLLKRGDLMVQLRVTQQNPGRLLPRSCWVAFSDLMAKGNNAIELCSVCQSSPSRAVKIIAEQKPMARAKQKPA
jgi:hypothetical protein